jgi:hypothetical protein
MCDTSLKSCVPRHSGSPFVHFLSDVSHMIVQCVTRHNYRTRLPQWFDMALLPLYETKIGNNTKSCDVSNYITKCYSPKLHWDFMTWGRIEHKLRVIHQKMRATRFQPDLFIGICSGGAFCVRYLAKLFDNRNIFYISSKQWSNTALATRILDTVNLHVLPHAQYVESRPIDITDIDGRLDRYARTCRATQPFSILLFDDSVASGKRFTAALDMSKACFTGVDRSC